MGGNYLKVCCVKLIYGEILLEFLVWLKKKG